MRDDFFRRYHALSLCYCPLLTLRVNGRMISVRFQEGQVIRGAILLPRSLRVGGKSSRQYEKQFLRGMKQRVKLQIVKAGTVRYLSILAAGFITLRNETYGSLARLWATERRCVAHTGAERLECFSTYS
jgi:hypothetical protein